MAETYLHGAYGNIAAVGTPATTQADAGMVVIGTAPVHTVENGADNVNTPFVIYNMAQAKKTFGYSEDWAAFTLCEAFHVFFEKNAVSPLIVINVLDPAKTAHKEAQGGTKTLTPQNGQVVIPGAEEIILDSLAVTSGSGEDAQTKEKGTDYTVSYDSDKKTITLTETAPGSLGTDALTITYGVIKPEGVTAADVIGATDGLGGNTGLYAVYDVYPKLGIVPAYLLAPGFSGTPAVRSAMLQVSRKINTHWDAFIYTDIPITADNTALTLTTAAAWKKTNGYTAENEKVFFPMALGTDGKYYHLSTLYAANFLSLLSENEGIPYHTASNTALSGIENVWTGADDAGRVYDDSIMNEKLCKNGITTAAFVGGRWVLWGAHTAEYDQENKNELNVNEVNMLMLFYLSNDFQTRRFEDVDKPVSLNDIQSIVGEEQTRLDALAQIGALVGNPEAYLDAEALTESDMYAGDFKFAFNVTPTPIMKSLTVNVNWTADGYSVMFGESDGE